MILPNSGVAKKNWWLLYVIKTLNQRFFFERLQSQLLRERDYVTVLPASSDIGVMSCLQSYQGLIIDSPGLNILREKRFSSVIN